MSYQFQKYSLFILLSLFLFASVLIGQESLQKIARESHAKWTKERQAAESIAVAQHMPIRVEQKGGKIIELQRFENGMPVYYQTDNISSAKTISVNKVWPGGSLGFALTGATDTLGEWDGGGVRMTHQEFGGRLLQSQGSLSDHSTHVAGTIMASGMDPNAKGMAYQGYLKEYDWNNDASEMASAAAAGLRVSNHSYGKITGWNYDYFSDGRWAWFGDTSISQTEDYEFGYYGAETQTWDNIAYNAPYYLIVKSAGNDRNEGPLGVVQYWFYAAGAWRSVSGTRPVDGGGSGYDCISVASLAKNVLTVGAVGNLANGYTQPGFVKMSSYSAWGPADDGRIKPDVVATGDTVYSILETSNSAYGWLSGTSMATPSVTGSVGLLLEQQRNMVGNNLIRSSTLKALIINTADETGYYDGPDYQYGWGQVNTAKAVLLMKQDSAEGFGSHIVTHTLAQDEVFEIPVSMSGGTPLRATICWTDPAGTPPAASNDNPTIMLKNDLDLRVIKNINQTTNYPFVLDPNSPASAPTRADNIRDNVEQVYIASPAKGTYTLRISHKGTLTGGSQTVSLVMSGNTTIGAVASYQYDTVKVTMIPNETETYTFRVYNNGDATLTYNADVLPNSWLTLENDSNDVGYNDSSLIDLNFNTTGLSQWSTYTTSITIESNDPSKPSKTIPVLLTILGPRIASLPTSIIVETETTVVYYDTLTLKNTGYAQLEYWISTDPSPMPGWLSVSSLTGTIEANDSLQLILTFDPTAQQIGDYSATLYYASNDSVRGTLSTTLDFHVASRRTVSVDVNPKWNLVSVPIKAFSYAKSALYPYSTSSAFLYNNGYTAQTILELGKGYWLKFDMNRTCVIDGYLSLVDTIDVVPGWNLIGSISSPLPVTNIISDPPGIVTSQFYSFNTAYYTIDTLLPGHGYWVKTDQTGKLILNAFTILAGSTIRIVPSPDLPPTPPDEGSSDPGNLIPKQFALEQNYPNPFNPVTVIRYSLSENSFVSLKIYNMLGVEVATLINGTQDAGFKSVQWDASAMPSGVYMYKLTTQSFSDVKRMLLMK